VQLLLLLSNVRIDRSKITSWRPAIHIYIYINRQREQTPLSKPKQVYLAEQKLNKASKHKRLVQGNNLPGTSKPPI
jgi:predicted nucleotidyltransferase